jgi:predicted secreted protein
MNKVALVGIMLSLGIGAASANKKPLPIYTEDSLNFGINADTSDFVIRLKDSSASTGFNWNKKPEYNHAIFEVKDHYKTPATSTLVGASGDETWVFHTHHDALKKSQSTTITFSAIGPAMQTSTNVIFNVTLTSKKDIAE